MKKVIFTGIGLKVGLVGTEDLSNLEEIQNYVKKNNIVLGAWSDGENVYIEPSTMTKRNEISDSELMQENINELAFCEADYIRLKKVKNLKKFLLSLINETEENRGASLQFIKGSWQVLKVDNLKFIENKLYKEIK
jgi:hypothetical protein